MYTFVYQIYFDLFFKSVTQMIQNRTQTFRYWITCAVGFVLSKGLFSNISLLGPIQVKNLRATK